MAENNNENKKAVVSWCMYDWANSAFATTVMAGFFPIFFKKYWSAGADVTESTAMLGAANSLGSLIIALLAPILGAVADSGTSRKKFLIFFAYLGALMSAALFMVTKGQWFFAVIIYVIGNIGFSGSNIFYDSLLPHITNKKRVDFISGLGYGAGYLGGGLLFALNVGMTLSPQTFGLADTSQAVRWSFITVGLWWGIFTIPLILFIKEPKGEKKKLEGNAVVNGFKQLKSTLSKIRQLKTVMLFLLAYWFYIDGVDSIIRMAVDYGMSIGFEPNDLIVALLITQFVGFPSAILYGKLGHWWGVKKSIYLAILIYIAITIWGMVMKEKYEFYILAIAIGLVQGGIQALSRSYYSRLIPKEQSGEFFGFANMLGKFAVILGPILIGVTGYFSGDPRVGLGSIIILFLAGAALLYFVDEEKGKEEAKKLANSQKIS